MRKKEGKIRNRYNQAPHLTQDTNGKVMLSQLDITYESQEVSPFPAGDHNASMNRRTRMHNINKTEITYMIHKKKHRLGTVSKKLKLASRRACIDYYSSILNCVQMGWFACSTQFKPYAYARH